MANVIVITSQDMLLGIQGHGDGYRHLTEGLGINADLHAVPATGISSTDVVSLAARRVPIIAVCDGEAGLVDNIGSIIGGLIISENIFAYPGMGLYFLDSFTNGDFPLLMPWMVLVVASTLMFNLIADVSYAFLDPRIRLD